MPKEKHALSYPFIAGELAKQENDTLQEEDAEIHEADGQPNLQEVKLVIHARTIEILSI